MRCLMVCLGSGGGQGGVLSGQHLVQAVYLRVARARRVDAAGEWERRGWRMCAQNVSASTDRRRSGLREGWMSDFFCDRTGAGPG